MSIIHKTTMTPTKLELLTAWLPGRPWYAGPGRPDLDKTGGFRLDDPQGAVGIEFMVVTDGAAAYHVPLSYRGAPLEGADDHLIGTAQHGVLGRRWIYDGTHDPVLLAALLALLQCAAEPQMQGVTDTPDPSVDSHFSGTVRRTPAGPAAVTHGPDSTGIDLDTDPAGPVRIHVRHVLRPGEAAPPGALGQVTAGWRQSDTTMARGVFAVLTGD